MAEPEFKAFHKIPRLFRTVTVTEKIDGTNALVYVGEDGEVRAGSRNRWVTPENDNFGFAGWVEKNKEELRLLGHGYHYGEWWGVGIQRGYGLTERRFSLFNSHRWGGADRPACCHVVPTIWLGEFKEDYIRECLEVLKLHGSMAAPRFTDPEGIMVFHQASGHLYKVTFDDAHKEAP